MLSKCSLSETTSTQRQGRHNKNYPTLNLPSIMKSNLLKIASFVVGIFAAAGSHAQAYQFIDLGNGSAAAVNNAGLVVGSSSLGATLWNGTSATGLAFSGFGYATAINNAGQIVGASVFHGAPNGALWSANNNTIASLNAPGSGISFANGINSAGQIVGGTGNSALLWSPLGGTTTTLTTSYSYNDVANAINNAGVIVGNSITFSGPTVATKWTGTNATALPGLGGDYTYANAINDTGVIVGSGNIASGSNTYLATEWKGSTITALGTLGGSHSAANAINNAGEIVGYSTSASGTELATMWNGTKALNLNTLLSPTVSQAGWVLTDATGINSQGWIVGDATNAKLGESDAFLLRVSPVPEADTYAMLLIGIGLIGARAYRKPASSKRGTARLA